MSKSQLSIFRGSWIADYADAENYLALFYSGNHSPNGPNYTHFSQTEFDHFVLEKSLRIPDLSKKFHFMKRWTVLLLIKRL